MLLFIFVCFVVGLVDWWFIGWYIGCCGVVWCFLLLVVLTLVCLDLICVV